jgi:hypothetical protein
MAVSRKELNPHQHELTAEQAANQEKLFVAINRVRELYARPMIITSGVRSWEQHAEIYRVLKRQPPKGSAHLTGAACDVSDRDRRLAAWCLDNVEKLREFGLYIEDPSTTSTWIHFQVTPPKSGNTVFMPFIKKARQ